MSLKILFCTLVIGLTIFNPVDAKDFDKIQLRKGISNFYHEIEKSDTVSIVYFGGSITNAPGWRVKSFKWFEEKYPENKFIQINASIGGTGSNLGAFRFQSDVLQHKPDLIFMEFAVNDSRTEKESILRQYEGIIRKLWTILPTCDICFVYTFKDEFADAYNSGQLPYTVIAAEEIAEHFGIPTVNFGVEIMNRVNTGELTFRGPKPQSGDTIFFSKDGVHPFKETGHQIYFEDFKDFEKQLSEHKNHKLKAHKLRKPLFEDNWQEARYLSFDEVEFSGDWKYPEKKNGLYSTESQNASLIFEFEGTMFGIHDIIGPDGTALDIVIDGVSQSKLRFDKYCTYDRTHYFFSHFLKPGMHKVEIKMGKKLSPEQKIEILKERSPNTEYNSSKFSGNIFRLKKVMIL